ncbi:MAG TPA: LamG domain-containing protein [Cellvibrio sp.]
MNKLQAAIKLLLLPAALVLGACAVSPVGVSTDASIWNINSLSRIGGSSAQVLGNPQVVNTALGTAVRFDGDGDRLLVDANPLGDANEFTIEIIFNPADAYPNNIEPRFFHIESRDNPNRRVTIELRLNEKKQWYLDAYIKSERSQFTLIDPTKVHPIGEWAHAAIMFKNRDFVSYVNGQQELVGQVDYLPIASNAKTSIGSRMNQVHWFKGDIAQARITRRALSPAEFLQVPSR